MSRSKKFLIIILLFLTLITGGFAIFIGLQTRETGGGDVSVSDSCTRWCAAGSCTFSNGDTFTFGDDKNSPQSSCQVRLDEACDNKAREISTASGRTITVRSKSGGGQLTCPTTGGGGTSTGGTVTNGASCITPGNNKALGDECNKLCGDNACDGSGPLGCNTCISGTKMGKSVCSVGANNASYFTACGMTKLVTNQACAFNDQCQSGSCANGKCVGSGGEFLPCYNASSANGSCGGLKNSLYCNTYGHSIEPSRKNVVDSNVTYNCTVNGWIASDAPAGCTENTGRSNECICDTNNQCSSGRCSDKLCKARLENESVCKVDNDCKSLYCQVLAGDDKCKPLSAAGGGGTSGGGTSGGGTVTPSGTIAVGQTCTPGLPSQCVAGSFCTLSPGGQYLCNPCTDCGNNFCPVGQTCGRTIGFKCTGDFGTECNLSDPGVQVFEDPGLTWDQAVALVGGCGQVDVVCSGNKQGCGDFQIFRNSCDGGGGGGDNPPTNLACNALCGGSLGSCGGGNVCTTVGSESRCRLPSNPTSATCSPVVVTPFCGDAVCQAGELCERVGTTGAAANEFRQCSNNQAITSCRNLATSAPSLANGCTFCGDGVFQSGVEQCDATAPSGGGNDPANCNALCQTVAPICIGMTQNPSFTADTISSGVGNIVEYELTYQNASATDPYPNIRLRVADPGAPTVPVGRDADNPTNALVAPAVPPTRNTTNSTWTYRFRWEAADTAGVDLPDGSYDIRALLDGTNATSVTSPAGCLEGITVDALVAEEPVFTVVKQGGLVCVADNSARIDYTISVTNSGPVAGSIDFVRDTLDPAIVALGIIPANIVPSFGTYSAGAITWVGTAGDLAFTAGQTKTYTYSITIPSTQVTNFRTTGVNNTVQVQYDTGTTTDNTTEFDLTTPMTCSIIVIPVTSIFTDSTRFLLMGMIFMIGGYTVYRYRIGSTQVQGFLKALIRPLNFEEMVLHDEKFREKGKKRR